MTLLTGIMKIEIPRSQHINYTNDHSFPKPGIDGYDLHVLTVNYYDDYYFLTNFPTEIKNDFQPSVGIDGFPTTPFTPVKGLLTGTRIFILDNSDSSVCAVNYYDDRYRLIQKQQTFYPSGFGITNTHYDFTGNVVETKEVQSVNQATNSLYTAYTYDHMQRPVLFLKQI